jgi:tetratricopeptide (TPR) repeat protein
MLGLLIILAFGLLAFVGAKRQPAEELDVTSATYGNRLGKLWDIAHQSMRESRFLHAEKALLTILRLDEKNAAAYNRLGILYSKQKEYKDAIDCFEIASSIDPSASSLHNLGLIYYETEHFEKAAIAFEQALKLESNHAARHVAYAKVQEQLGHLHIMTEQLEKAVELDPNKETLTLLHKAYLSQDMQKDADLIEDRLHKLIVPSGRGARPRRMARRPRVVA